MEHKMLICEMCAKEIQDEKYITLIARNTNEVTILCDSCMGYAFTQLSDEDKREVILGTEISKGN